MKYTVIFYTNGNGIVRRNMLKIEGWLYQVDSFLETVENLIFAIVTRENEDGEYIFVSECFKEINRRSDPARNKENEKWKK